MLHFKPSFLINILVFVVYGSAYAASEEGSPELLQPSAWAARGFVYPEGGLKCIVEIYGSLNDEKFKHICSEAKLGNAKAQHNLGQLFFLTKGAEERDNDEAYKWFSLAAEQDLPIAQYAVGLLHFYGLGIVGDHGLAMKWLLKAANNGHMNAQYLLGLHYAASIRGKNMDEASKWLRLSAEQGHELAQEVLTNTLKRTTLNSRLPGDPAVEYTVNISHVACSEDFDINSPKYPANSDRKFTRNDARTINSNKYTYFTKSDLIRAINESHEKYIGLMETCFHGLASTSGAGYVKSGFQ